MKNNRHFQACFCGAALFLPFSCAAYAVKSRGGRSLRRLLLLACTCFFPYLENFDARL
jgi:hypothetical protein